MTSRTDWPQYAAASGTHERVLEIITKLLSENFLKNAVACDVPCGAGAFSQSLAELGVNVTAVDIAPADTFVFDPSKRLLHNCNQGLPFENDSLDIVVSIEGIEHLENPTNFLRECMRVAKPEGLVIITTPNVDSFRSRKYVFYRGYHRYFGPKDEGKDSGHMLPVDAIFMISTIRKLGFKLINITTNKPNKRSLLKEFLRKMLQKRLP